MSSSKKHFRLLSIILLSLLFSCGIGGDSKEKDAANKRSELTKIMKSGKLHALVDYNSTSYFVYRGRPMGFQYELLQLLAKDMGLELEISVSNNLKETFDGLNSKRYDLVAKNLTVTKKRDETIAFTTPLDQTRQVLVQRKPSGWQKMSPQAVEDSLIRNQLDLAGKKIHVQRNTAYYRRLVNLSDEIGEEIIIMEDSGFGVEKLVSMVANGEIDYTVCDENVAKVNQSYFPNLDVATPVSFPQNIAWAVRNDSGEWLKYLNNWIRHIKKTADYNILYKKYFENNRMGTMVASGYHSIEGGKISPYDGLIKMAAKKANMDWRLIASIIYRESKFDAEAISWAGAYGLMQVMPGSADMFRINDYEDPEVNIDVGVRLLKRLDEGFAADIPDPSERLKFVLASYNVGLGHVKDAQRLAEKYDRDPTIWKNNVDYFLLNKSAAKFFKDPVVKWGYCRGEEPYNYVNKVLATYRHYRNIIEE
jgi:membrane-bound lytic murein transglycosylase F